MYTLAQIAKFVDAKIVGDSTIQIDSIASATTAKSTQLTYISGKRHNKALVNSQAGAIILNEELLNDCPTNALVVDDTYLAFAKITHYFKKQITHQAGIHPSAKINNAQIANNCVIGKNVVIGSNIIFNNGVSTDNTVIEDNVIIGNDIRV